MDAAWNHFAPSVYAAQLTASRSTSALNVYDCTAQQEQTHRRFTNNDGPKA
ncbi:hypothetical protein HDF14_005528 [Edaphobacter lichenicola]|uniref:Uncharacterized protein n=1 Tax=Tunturiibacter gelidiferens TaxID=3069689 RepID=A0A9X0QJY3_9BACT|nr:hypothetical protein [Edaphobacter lichenicola]